VVEVTVFLGIVGLAQTVSVWPLVTMPALLVVLVVLAAAALGNTVPVVGWSGLRASLVLAPLASAVRNTEPRAAYS
jgi:hypothetical protein